MLNTMLTKNVCILQSTEQMCENLGLRSDIEESQKHAKYKGVANPLLLSKSIGIVEGDAFEVNIRTCVFTL